jgi:hypothetical protein
VRENVIPYALHNMGDIKKEIYFFVWIFWMNDVMCDVIHLSGNTKESMNSFISLVTITNNIVHNRGWRKKIKKKIKHTKNKRKK